MNWQVTGVLVFLLGLMGWMLKNEIESRVKFEVAAQAAEAALEFQKKTAGLNQELADYKASGLKEVNDLKNSQAKEIREIRRTMEKAYAKDPFGAANDTELRLAISLCLYENGNNREGRSSCYDRVAGGYAPKFASLLAVTQDTVEDWRILCEEGHQDFCNYTLIAFTKDGWLDHLQWHGEADRDQLALRDQLQAERAWRAKQQEITRDNNR